MPAVFRRIIACCVSAKAIGVSVANFCNHLLAASPWSPKVCFIRMPAISKSAAVRNIDFPTVAAPAAAPTPKIGMVILPMLLILFDTAPMPAPKVLKCTPVALIRAESAVSFAPDWVANCDTSRPKRAACWLILPARLI